MGRVKQYSRKQKQRSHSKANKKQKRADEEMKDNEEEEVKQEVALTIGKKKQMFKKGKAKEIKAKI